MRTPTLIAAVTTLAAMISASLCAAEDTKNKKNGDSSVALPNQADIAVFVSQQTVTQLANAVMPLTLRGTEVAKVTVPVAGEIEVKVPWVAVVSNPKIVIIKDAAQFDADVAVTAGPLNYKDTVHGDLDVTYDKKKNQLVIKVNKAVMNLKLRPEQGPAMIKVDVADQLPLIDLPVGLPSPVLKVAKKAVRLELDPKVGYQEGAVAVTSSVKVIVPKHSERQ